MKRINFYIPEKLLAELKRRQKQTGIPIAEQIRQAIKAKLTEERK